MHFCTLVVIIINGSDICLVQILLALSELFGDSYATHIMLPVFLIAVGDDGDLTHFPSAIQSKIKGR